jgi:hypothetical protein
MFNFFFRKKENKGNLDYQNEVKVAPVIKRVKKQWRPERYSEAWYWYITDGHGVGSEMWCGNATDIARLKAGNLFKTRTEARTMRDRVKKFFGKK